MKSNSQVSKKSAHANTTETDAIASAVPVTCDSSLAGNLQYVQSNSSKLFTSMDSEAFEAFKRDIALHGQREPILIRGNEIIDGWHRYRACVALCIPPRFESVDASVDVQALSISLNLQRRQLSTSQRAVVAARLTTSDWAANLQGGDIGEGATDVWNVTQAADRLAVSERSVRLARRVLDSGDDELIGAVERDQVAVSVAAAIAKKEFTSDRSAALARVLNQDEQAPIRAVRTQLLRRLAKPLKATQPPMEGTSDGSVRYSNQEVVEPMLQELCTRFEKAAEVLGRAVLSFTTAADVDLVSTHERVKKSISSLQRALRMPVQARSGDKVQ